jgi:hypothetical protein
VHVRSVNPYIYQQSYAPYGYGGYGYGYRPYNSGGITIRW